MEAPWQSETRRPPLLHAGRRGATRAFQAAVKGPRSPWCLPKAFPMQRGATVDTFGGCLPARQRLLFAETVRLTSGELATKGIIHDSRCDRSNGTWDVQRIRECEVEFQQVLHTALRARARVPQSNLIHPARAAHLLSMCSTVYSVRGSSRNDMKGPSDAIVKP